MGSSLGHGAIQCRWATHQRRVVGVGTDYLRLSSQRTARGLGRDEGDGAIAAVPEVEVEGARQDDDDDDDSPHGRIVPQLLGQLPTSPIHH